MKNLFKKIVISILEAEARAVLKKYKPTIIAVTGSVGKTSTKDAIYSVLQKTGFVRKSDKSFNSEIGVPLTILGLPNGWSNPFIWLQNIAHGLELIFLRSEYPKTLVIEVGADHPGDIKRVADWLCPDIAVITTVSKVPVHVEFFPSREALLAEKLALARAVKPSGILVLPAFDEEVLAIRTELPNKCYTIGIDTPGDVTASFITTMYSSEDDHVHPTGVSFKLNHQGNSIPTKLMGVLGVQHIYPMLTAAAVGLARGMSMTAILEAIPGHIPPRGRMNIIRGINNTTLIDDTYNASPDAVKEALIVLASLAISAEGVAAGHDLETTTISDAVTHSKSSHDRGGRKIAILGDMMELGKYSREEHEKAGELAGKSCDMLILVGLRARDMRESAMKAGLKASSIADFSTAAEAAEAMPNVVKPGDIILIKGSQSTRCERITKALLADPEKAEELLVRQNPEWLAKK